MAKESKQGITILSYIAIIKVTEHIICGGGTLFIEMRMLFT